MPGRGETPEMESFVNSTGTSGFEHLIDADGSFWAEFGISGQPAFAFVHADGTIEPHLGGLGESELTQRVEALLS